MNRLCHDFSNDVCDKIDHFVKTGKCASKDQVHGARIKNLLPYISDRESIRLYEVVDTIREKSTIFETFTIPATSYSTPHTISKLDCSTGRMYNVTHLIKTETSGSSYKIKKKNDEHKSIVMVVDKYNEIMTENSFPPFITTLNVLKIWADNLPDMNF